jgi:hypothetical protein
MIMKLKAEARAQGGCRASEKKMAKDKRRDSTTKHTKNKEKTKKENK